MRRCLSPRELSAADELIRRVRVEVPAELAFALLFGSRARRQARPDSDEDVLLVFRRLAWDREPQAGMAEQIADRVARRTGIPVATWTVSLPDLARGRRTPMLVDALADGVPLWPRRLRVLRLPFTPADALSCTRSLLDRVAEGSAEVNDLLASGRYEDAAKRTRDDLVRMCTAALLLVGETRPRYAQCVARFVDRFVDTGGFEATSIDAAVLRWAVRSYGPDGKDADRVVARPPGGLQAAAMLVDRLRLAVSRSRCGVRQFGG